MINHQMRLNFYSGKKSNKKKKRRMAFSSVPAISAILEYYFATLEALLVFPRRRNKAIAERKPS